MKKRLQLSVIVFLIAFFGNAQNKLFKQVENNFAATSKVVRDAEPKESSIYSLDLNNIKSILATAPTRTATATSNVIVAFPNSADRKSVV